MAQRRIDHELDTIAHPGDTRIGYDEAFAEMDHIDELFTNLDLTKDEERAAALLARIGSLTED